MKAFSDMNYHPLSEELVEVLKTKTQNSNPLFFRVIVAFYFGLVASQMRASIKGWVGKGLLPINNYVIALQNSGSGKGHSTTTMEQEVLKEFRDIFISHTFEVASECNRELLADKLAAKKGTDSFDEREKLDKVFNDLGALMFSFDSATVPAIKQMRQKLLIANAGSCNLIIDEISANLSNSFDPLISYLELYDKGLIRDKLVKSTAENQRYERIDGYTPANLLMFGTPTKLLDGSKTETLFNELLEMGYARRCLFGFSNSNTRNQINDVDELMAQLFNNNHDDTIARISSELTKLANPSYLNKILTITPEAIRLLLEYRIHCENQAREISEYEAIRKAELEHRYFKTLKLAGTYSFIDDVTTIDTQHIEYAIKLVEDSGESFTKLLSPQRPYIKLANYLADVNTEVTLADLDEDLPSFKGSKAQKDEIITMAIAWGYKNNIVIKKSYTDSILFLSADTIKETNVDEIIISYSNDMTTGYLNKVVPFNKLDKLLLKADYHWLSHHLQGGYRKEDNCLIGFNLLVLDVDGTCNLNTAKLLLKGYKAIYQTTKRHTNTQHRFRIILPMNYTLKLDAKEYKEFYNNIRNSLPFDIDESCSHRSKKWLTNDKAIIEYTDGELFDVLPYIPKTTKNEERTNTLKNQADLDNLERWVINNTAGGNRNNMLLRYALLLLESGYTKDSIQDKVIGLNNKMVDKLDDSEIYSTIMYTVDKRIHAR